MGGSVTGSGTVGSPVLAYFAYGSNLCVRRLRARVPDVRFRQVGSLPGYVLKWHKRSVDDSAKCSIFPQDRAGTVHGAIFAVPEDQKAALDKAEGLGSGYEEIEVEVETSGDTRSCFTYIAETTHIDDSLQPYSWYRDLVVAGAEAVGLPPDYLDSLRCVAAAHDPDMERDARERRAIPCQQEMVDP